MNNRLLYLAVFIMISAAGSAQTDKITFTAPKLYPEGVAFNEKTKTFYVSSVKTGTIGAVDQNGKYIELYKDTSLKSSFGMKVDARGNKLWICIGDPNYSKYSDSTTFKKMARVIALDLTSGKKVMDINIADLRPGKHFVNDLALDGQGNIYVTDSFAPVIYRIDDKGKASVFASNPMFGSMAVGLNGIVFHPSGYLLVAHNTDGSILKVPVKSPSAITKVKLKTFLPGADGMLLDKSNNLIVVVNKGIDKVFKLTSTDHWNTAEITEATTPEDHFQNPTTAAFEGEKVYVLNSKMNELSDSTKSPSRDFSIQLVRFKAVR